MTSPGFVRPSAAKSLVRPACPYGRREPPSLTSKAPLSDESAGFETNAPRLRRPVALRPPCSFRPNQCNPLATDTRNKRSTPPSQVAAKAGSPEQGKPSTVLLRGYWLARLVLQSPDGAVTTPKRGRDRTEIVAGPRAGPRTGPGTPHGNKTKQNQQTRPGRIPREQTVG